MRVSETPYVLRLIALDVDVEVGRVVEVVGGDAREPGVLAQLALELPGRVVDLLGVHAGDGEGVLALVLARRAGADLQDRVRPEQRQGARDSRPCPP